VKAVVLGGGLAGLSAAWGLRRAGADTLVVEASPVPGGNAGGFHERGYTFDFFAQRLHPEDPDVLRLCAAWSGSPLVHRPSQTRAFVEGRLIRVPPRGRDLWSPRGFSLAASAFVGRLQGRVLFGARTRQADLAAFLTTRYGQPITERFLAPYVLKVSGLPPEALAAGPGRDALGALGARSFFYPEAGFAALADGMTRALTRAGAEVLLGSRVSALRLRSGRIEAVEAEGAQGRLVRRADVVISTLPLASLLDLLDPGMLKEPRHAVRQLRTRAMVVLYLGVRRERLTGDHGLYVPDPEVRFHRLSETTACSPRLAPRATTGLCLEIPCEEGDALYREDDRRQVARAIDDLRNLGFLRSTAEIESAWVRRFPAALPLATRGHRDALEVVEAGLGRIRNLHRCGCQGAYYVGGAREAIRAGLDAGPRAGADPARTSEPAAA
jgi:protoporphyrinogen oxidase